eukprot:COSAG02_NODE_2774_length_8057_cov_4.361146_1_plen_164_part_00
MRPLSVSLSADAYCSAGVIRPRWKSGFLILVPPVRCSSVSTVAAGVGWQELGGEGGCCWRCCRRSGGGGGAAAADGINAVTAGFRGFARRSRLLWDTYGWRWAASGGRRVRLGAACAALGPVGERRDRTRRASSAGSDRREREICAALARAPQCSVHLLNASV